ncbi:MAG: hypothetical protein QE278_13300 [Limnobacter sp.]|nr:hypothetical protein [Limnobacter sp.]
MGWNSIENTANRQQNLAKIERSSQALYKNKTQINKMLADLVASSAAIKHLVDGAGAVQSTQRANNQNHIPAVALKLLPQLTRAEALTRRELAFLNENTNLATQYKADYQKVRDERPAPKLSGNTMASRLGMSAYASKITLSVNTRGYRTIAPHLSAILERSSTALTEEHVAAIRNFVSTYSK